MNQTIKSAVKRLPILRRVAQSPTAQKLQHSLRLRLGKRRNYTYTQFLRLPTQYQMLCGPVLQLVQGWREDGEIRIAVVGCSYGAEAYTIASVMRAKHPQLNFAVRAFDLVQTVIAKARLATFTAKEIAASARSSPEFVDSTFDRVDQGGVVSYEVKPEIRRIVTFSVADALDPNIADSLGTADIVFAQNFLYHLKPSGCRIAFANLVSLLDSRGVLFVDGMDLGLKTKLVREFNLVPFDQAIEDIHAEAYHERGASWPAVYWGLERLDRSRSDWKARYSTIFIRENQTATTGP